MHEIISSLAAMAVDKCLLPVVTVKHNSSKSIAGHSNPRPANAGDLFAIIASDSVTVLY